MPAKQELTRALEQFGFAPGPVPVMITPEVVQAMIERLRPIIDPDVECEMVGPGADGLVGRFEGIAGLAEAWDDWLSAFETLHLDSEELIDAGDAVVALGRQVAKSATAGVKVENAAAAVWRIRDERLVRVEFHLDRDAALRSAGLDPADYRRQE